MGQWDNLRSKAACEIFDPDTDITEKFRANELQDQLDLDREMGQFPEFSLETWKKIRHAEEEFERFAHSSTMDYNRY